MIAKTSQNSEYNSDLNFISFVTSDFPHNTIKIKGQDFVTLETGFA